MKQKSGVSQNTSETGVKPPKLSQKKRKVTTPSGVIVHLTPAQKKYGDTKLANPDMALSDVAHQAYPNAAPQTLRQIVNQNEKNKDITIYTDEQADKAAQTVVEIMNDESAKPDTRLKAADSLLDRKYGKAVQAIQTHNTSVNLNVEVDNEMSEAFTAFLKGFTKQG